MQKTAFFDRLKILSSTQICFFLVLYNLLGRWTILQKDQLSESFVFCIIALLIILGTVFFIWCASHKNTFGIFAIIFTLLTLQTRDTALDQSDKERELSNRVVSLQATLKDINWKSDFKTELRLTHIKREVPYEQELEGDLLVQIDEFCTFPKESKIYLKAKLAQGSQYRTEGVFDLKQFLLHNRIISKAYLKKCEAVTLTQQASLSWHEKQRLWLMGQIYSSDLENKDVISALMLGQDTLSETKQTLYKNLGIIHLMVISGAQFTALALLAYLTTRGIIRIYPTLLFKIPKIKLTALMTLAYFAVASPLIKQEAPVIRAEIMAILTCLVILCEWHVTTLTLFLITIILHMALVPTAILSSSFYLSYGACYALLVLMNKISQSDFFKEILNNESHNSNPRRIIKIVCGMIVFPLLLNLILFPLHSSLFGTLNLWSFIHNLWLPFVFDILLAPLVFIVMAVGLISGYFESPFLFLELMMAMNHVFSLFNELMLQCWQVFPITYLLPKLHVGHTVLFYVMMTILFYAKRHVLKIGIVMAFIMSLLITAYDYYGEHQARVMQIDVGQGDAIYFEMGRETVLIDTGGVFGGDMAHRVLIPFFQYRWRQSIDHLILTHPDWDHIGGAEGLVLNNKVRNIYVSEYFSDDPAIVKISDACARYDCIFHYVKNGFMLKTLGADFKFFAIDDENYPSKNDHSLLVMTELFQKRFLLMGDASSEIESLFLRMNKIPKIDVLKIGHHGSKTSTSEEFLQNIKPDICLAGIGFDNRYHHPHPRVIETLKESSCEFWRTDLMGTITILLNKREMKITSYENRKSN